MRFSALVCAVLLGAGLPSAGHAASITALSLVGFPGEDPSISILQVTGAAGIVTQGGIATADTRTLYLYDPDIQDPSVAPLYGSGGGAAIAWPLVYIADPAALVIAPGITADIATVSHVDARTGATGQLLTIEGSPAYQFTLDNTPTDHTGVDPLWPVISASGVVLYSLAPVGEPSTAMMLLGSLGLLAGLRTRRARKAVEPS